jgi:phosphorylase kinase alpha/beta subunit
METIHTPQTNLALVNSHAIRSLMKPQYTLEDVRSLTGLLESSGTFLFPALPTGLFSAAILGADKNFTGYSSAWVRDNIYVAFSHYYCGDHAIAVRNVSALMTYFKKHQQRFCDIIESRVDPQIPMNRPHVRFDGNSLEDFAQDWPHAQNDALGYFLWLYCKVAGDRRSNLSPQREDFAVLKVFVLYFHVIQYWQDQDSGHWEETRKINASSIGVVIAALQELKKLLTKAAAGSPTCVNDIGFDTELIDSLIAQGKAALEEILPHECIQPDPSQNRPVDSALLFLIYPLQVIEGEAAARVLQNVLSVLMGDYGIRRYLGDSYWAPDYKDKLAPAARSGNFSEDMSFRDSLLPAKMMEAQWCIFDPIVSCIFGKRFQEGGEKSDLEHQTLHLNRALGQITGENPDDEVPALRCPEAYYLRHGQYVPNDHVPLLWTQANLRVALKVMEHTCLLLRP